MTETLAAHRSLPLTDLSEDEQSFRSVVRDFAEEKLRPLVSRMDHEAQIPRKLIDACFELGIMGIEIPEKHGGAGATFFMSVLVVEELARVDASLAVLVDVQNTLVNNAVLRWGSDDQKRRILPGLAARQVGAYALSEAGSGSDAFALQTRARQDGDDFVLEGRKLWITNGNEADWFIVFATIDPAAGYRGITAFLVERGTTGFTIGHKEDKLGIRASSTCELLFENCRVGRANVLGEVGKGYKVAIETLNEGRIGIGAQMVGLAAGVGQGVEGDGGDVHLRPGILPATGEQGVGIGQERPRLAEHLLHAPGPGTRHRLIRGGHHRPQPGGPVQRCHPHHQGHRGAVRVGDDPPVGGEIVVVDTRHHQGDVGITTESR